MDRNNNNNNNNHDIGPVPSPEDVDLEYTYPNDFIGRSWEDVLGDKPQFFRLLIDPSCTKMELYKFMHCAFLIEVVFLKGCTILRIGKFAFCDCKNLQRMNPLPEGLTSIDERAFLACASLRDEIILPSTIILVGRSCFGGCKSIRSVAFTEPLTTTASTTTAATVFVEIRAISFHNCDELQSVRLPRNLLYIPVKCFAGCSRLIEVHIPLSVREIRHKSFFGCVSLTSIDLSENINGIENEAYSGCLALKNVTIRSSNNTITMGNNIFRGCPAISSLIVFPSVWPKLFQSMNNHAIEIDTTQRRESHYNNMGDRTDNHPPDFIYKFLKEYHYQIDRIIELKKSEEHGERMITLNLCGDTNCEIDEEVDDGKRRRLR